MTPVRLFVATPSKTGGVEGGYYEAMLRTRARFADLEWSLLEPPRTGSSHTVDIARCQLIETMLTTDATHLGFIDADMVWRAEDLERMLRADVDLVAAPYTMRDHDWNRVNALAGRGIDARVLAASLSPALITREEGGRTLPVKHPHLELLEADYAPGGFQLWKRDALARLVEAWRPKATHQIDSRGTKVVHVADFAIVERVIGGETVLVRDGEDVTLCRRWRELGGRVWLDVGARFEHIGPCSYYSPSLAEHWHAEATLRKTASR